MTAAAAPRPSPGTRKGSQALLTQIATAGKGNSVQTQESAPVIQAPTPIPDNAIRHGACGRWWTGAERSHASCCHQTFSSLTAFERHRRGMRCNDPASVGLVAREKPYGTLWGLPGPANGYAAIHGDEEPTS